MAFTLAFHIILVPLGVSWAFMTLIANYRTVRHHDADALLLAQRWSKYMAVTFAVGAVTGTVLSFEFGLLWPRFMGTWGEAFGVPFAFEGLFFFTEAIFVAIYIYGWRRLRPWTHFWTGVPIAVAGVFGAISVVAANAWMNAPSGFTLNSAGEVVDVDPRKVIFNEANDRHPNGLANGSDQVGRNYLFHNSRAFLAVSTEKNDTRFQKTLGVNDYYFGDPDFDYPMGNLQMVGKSSAPMYRGEKPLEAGLAPTFLLGDVAEHAVDFWLSVEDLPDPDNRVTLDRDGQVVLSYTSNNQEPMEQLYHRVKKHLSHLGMHPHHLIPRDVYMKNDFPVAGCAHQAGTVRFGSDATTSVLDTDCKAHELDNLYVVDTSFVPSIGAVNPVLTAIANALRVGDHLFARLG
jgi:hypothetical protein